MVYIYYKYFYHLIFNRHFNFQSPVTQDITRQITDVLNVTQELGVQQVLQVVLIVLVEKHLLLDLPLRKTARRVVVSEHLLIIIDYM